MNILAVLNDRPAQGTELSWIAALAEQLQSQRKGLLAAFAQDTGYSTEDAELLFDAALEFVMAMDRTPLPEPLAWQDGAAPFIAKLPWGRVLITIPANATLPLAVILPVAFAHAGNSVLVCGNRALEGTIKYLADISERCGVPVTWRNEGSLAVISEVLDAPSVDLLYVVGSSRHFPGIAQRCAEAGVDLIFEGEGAGIAVFDALEPAALQTAITSLVEAKWRWRGQMCSSPLVVYVPQSHSRAFADGLDKATHGFSWGTQVPVTLSEQVARHIEDIERINGLEAGNWRAPLQQVCAIGPVPEGNLFSMDVFGPVFFYRSYSTREQLMTQLEGSRYGLQTTVYSQDREFVGSLLGVARVSRFCVNRMPALQDPMLPWGGYRKSGRSEVISFIEKAYRHVIVESG